jgi:transcriptional regulator with XRE-family HTH domain
MDRSNDKNNYKDLGIMLKQARLKAKLTQADVANEAGINVNYYARIERGEINTTFEKIQTITKVLKLKSLKLP